MTIADAYRAACLAELDALKPGNAHRHAPHPRLSIADFETSARVSAGPLAAPGARVGKRILDAVAATRAAVGRNTNLGIVLLCAPLASAAERGGDLRAALAATLADLDRDDAAQAFAAIRLADPGGLGRADSHDVAAPPAVTLRAAMAAAAGRDRIARQYATEFEDVFALGLPALAAARRDGLSEGATTSAAFLAFLGAFADTHVARNHGPAAAEAVRAEGALWRDRMQAERCSDEMRRGLLDFDARLKARDLNPGTSADLTVATLFADALARRAPTCGGAANLHT